MRKNILNIYGLGKMRFSASLASALAIPLFYAVSNMFQNNAWLANAVFFSFILMFSVREIYHQDIKDDPKEVVVDEFLGMYALLLFCLPQPQWYYILLLFIGFRFFDLFKMPPFSWIDRWRWKYAILLDDIAIGIFLGVVYRAWLIFI